MQGDDIDAADVLSRDRLEGFRDSHTDTDKLLVGRYLLNAAVSEALHPHLHALEVVLRNRLDSAASVAFPIERRFGHTYRDYPCWLDSTRGPLTSSHVKLVENAKVKLSRSLRSRYGNDDANLRRLQTPGRLVSALPLSFWVFLFDTDYSGDRTSEGSLWPVLLRPVFPHCDRPKLSLIRRRLRRALVLRNRVMHHERVHPSSNGRGFDRSPDQARADILEMIGWMSQRTAKILNRFDRIPEVMHLSNQRYLRWIPWRY